MVSRRTRSYKDKRPAGIFGQFMLPIAVIMAIALLYFSIKLFFLNTGGSGKKVAADTKPVVTVEAPVNEPAVSAEPSAPPARPRPAQVVAGPVDGQAAQAGLKPQQPAVRPVEAKPATAPPATPAAKPQPAAPKPPEQPAAAKRYDVQIGAFSARENAVQLVQKVRAQGYDVYVNESERDGPPYRVRVRGSADRQQTEALSAKLKAQGYPIYVITIN